MKAPRILKVFQNTKLMRNCQSWAHSSFETALLWSCFGRHNRNLAIASSNPLPIFIFLSRLTIKSVTVKALSLKEVISLYILHCFLSVLSSSYQSFYHEGEWFSLILLTSRQVHLSPLLLPHLLLKSKWKHCKTLGRCWEQSTEVRCCITTVSPSLHKYLPS